MTETEYSYELINNESDALACAELIAKEFSSHNPITVFDRIRWEDFYREVSYPLMKMMLEENLSFLVRHKPSGKMVGGLFAGDLYRYHHLSPYDLTSAPAMIAASDLLDDMDNAFITKDFGRDLKENLVLHVTVAAVSHEHSNRGLLTRLSETVCRYAKEKKGFRYAFVQVTNPITRHIYVNKLHGQVVTEVDPTQWIWTKKDPMHRLKPYEYYSGGSIPNILLDLKHY